MSSFPDEQSRSAALARRAAQVLPGGNTRTTVYHAPYPIYAASGEGCRIVDVDGVERIDLLNNYTALLHGHRHGPTLEAVQAQLGKGFSFAHPTEWEITHAEILCSRVPSVERVRYMNSGTEAVMTAIKAAHAYTGRPKIAKCEGVYHGSYDPVEVSLETPPEAWGEGPPPSHPYWPGMPAHVLDAVVVIPFNDLAGTRAALTPHAGELAAIIVDLMPNRSGLIPMNADYLHFLRDFTHEHGIVLIFDEVITLRVAAGGMQSLLGVQPDLTTMGKVIGGGFAVGAVGGSAEVMEVFSPARGKPALPHGGTFNANPVTMAAGVAALQAWDEAAASRLNALGDQAREACRAAFRRAEVPGQVTGQGSLLMLHPHDRPLRNYRDSLRRPEEKAMMTRLHQELINEGLLISPTGLTCLSTPMGEGEVAHLGEGLLAALKRLRQGG